MLSQGVKWGRMTSGGQEWWRRRFEFQSDEDKYNRDIYCINTFGAFNFCPSYNRDIGAVLHSQNDPCLDITI